jgi:hypothetical protein
MCPETFNLRVITETILYMHHVVAARYRRVVQDILSNTYHDR